MEIEAMAPSRECMSHYNANIQIDEHCTAFALLFSYSIPFAQRQIGFDGEASMLLKWYRENLVVNKSANDKSKPFF